MRHKAIIPGRKALPAAFTYTQARAAGISAERLYAYRSQGLIDQLARGLYRWADAPEIDQDLLEIAHRAPRGTLCLVTALARHELTDIIPPRIDIALPRGSRIPALRKTIDVHVFARETFDLGREELAMAINFLSAFTLRNAHSSTSSGCVTAKGQMSRGKRFAAGFLAKARNQQPFWLWRSTFTAQKRLCGALEIVL